MSLPLTLDNRSCKQLVANGMDLRSSTVNQRSLALVVAQRIRKSVRSVPYKETFENHSLIRNGGSESLSIKQHRGRVGDCARTNKNNSQADIDNQKLEGSDEYTLLSGNGDREFERPISEFGSANLNCDDGSMISNTGQQQLSLNCLGAVKNNESIILPSSVNTSNKGQRNHHDLSNSPEQTIINSNKPTTTRRQLNKNLAKNSPHQTPVAPSKRLRGVCRDYNSVESHIGSGSSSCSSSSSSDNSIGSVGDIACSCRDRSSPLDNMDAPAAPIPKIAESTELHQALEKNNLCDDSNYGPRNRVLIQPHKLVSLGERNGRTICNKHMPWFGIDVGGSLVKVVFFDPKDATKEETVTLKRIRRYLKSSKAYGTTGKRDAHLEMSNCIINKRVGTLHFIRFATNQMPNFLAMAKNKRFADTINNVCATGGGAYKFEEDIKKNLNITLHKTDELDSIIHGIHYIDKYNSERECYFLKDPLDDSKCVKVPYDFSRPYPYLVVNIGSGVSILAVYSSTSYSRISGSSIGGGTFLGLCCLLTQCKTFDEAIRLANNGSSTKIDKLVKDIYGGDYPKFNLSGDTVASSFGHMNVAEKRKDVKREDLARALLEMVTINIGSISRMCAANENIDRVVFIGNFLRVNQLSMKLLSYAVNYWSKGAIKALFLEHEGYFGAVGCFVESTQGCCHN